MTSIFDGLAGVLNDVFGAPVSYTAPGGSAVLIGSIFREEPVEYLAEEAGPVNGVRPVWKVPQPQAATVQRGGILRPDNGKAYRVLASTASGSPAADAFVIFDLEEITP